jgi:hypothetical protein
MIEQTDLAGNFTLPGMSITLNRMGYGAMQLAGRDGNKLPLLPIPGLTQCRQRHKLICSSYC